MKMKMVLVPIDEDAESRVEYNDQSEDDVIMVFFNDNDYNELWKTRLYRDINNKVGAGIDDSEDEIISGRESLLKLHSILDKYDKKIDNPIIPTLKSLTAVAIRFNTSIHFYY